MMSIGLLWLQTGGRTVFSASIVSGEIADSRPPPPMSASVAMTPGPPALVTIERRGPRGLGCLERMSETMNSSLILSTRSTPARRKAASRTSSEPVREPVCEAAAFAASAVRPGLMTMIGFDSATSRAADRKARASPMVSM